MPTPLAVAKQKWGPTGRPAGQYSRLSAVQRVAHWDRALQTDPYNPALHGLRAWACTETPKQAPIHTPAPVEALLDVAALTGSRLASGDFALTLGAHPSASAPTIAAAETE